jgi:hypothetical protein
MDDTSVTYGPAVNIGVSKETVAELNNAIFNILTSGAEQKTLRKALDVLGRACRIENTMISGCSFVTGQTEKRDA